MQPKKFSEYTPITTTDGTEVIPFEKGGVNGTVLSRDLPVSTIAQSALDLKADETDLLSHVDDTSNPHQVTQAQVGLGNVDNTSDINKPVSTATQSALNTKQPLDSDLTVIAGLIPSNDDVLQRKAGAWINRTPAQLKTDLVLIKADVGLASVDNTSDVNKPVSTAQQTALNLKANDSAVVHNTGAESISGVKTFGSAPVVPTAAFPESAITNLVSDLASTEKTANKGATNGYASLDSGGKIPSAQLPSIAISDTFVVSSQSAMLALTAQTGDVAIRTDTNTTYILTTTDPTTLANWKQILTPAAPVQSVNGYTGTVLLAKSDIGLSNVDNTSDVNKPVSTATTTALALKSNIASPTFTGTPAAPTATQGNNSTQIATTAYVDAAAAAVEGSDVDSFNGRIGTVTPQNGDYTAAMVGLGNVDNTSDVSKPVSTATQTAINAVSLNDMALIVALG